MLSYFVRMLENLKLRAQYDGFLFLAEAAHNPPKLNSHHHVELELNLVVRGSITYVVNETRYTFPQGTLLWFFPAQEHQLVDRSGDAQYYVSVFKRSLIKHSCRSTVYSGLKSENFATEGVLHAILDPEAFDLTRRNMDALMEGALDPEVLNREVGFGLSPDFRFEHNDPDGLNAGLHHLLLLCWRYQQNGKSRCPEVPLHPAVCKALRLLSEGDMEVSLSTLARRCGVSSPYLSRTFGRQVGVPLNHYRNAVRLGRFWKHYKGSEQKTITESVFAAGFGSYARFHKVFTQAHGQGPRECLRDANAPLRELSSSALVQ